VCRAGCGASHAAYRTSGVFLVAPLQAITIAGAKMSQAEKIAPQLKRWLATLDKWSNDNALEARIRFKIKDLSDQVKMDWQSRRTQNTVKKTEDIRKQAHAELGMLQTAVPDFLPGLNIGATVALSAKEVCDVVVPSRFAIPLMG
jgi:hypothetical protein